MSKRIGKQMVIASKPVSWIGLMKSPAPLFAIKTHARNSKIWCNIPMAHFTHRIFNMLRRGWLEVCESNLRSIYIKIQRTLHRTVYLMARTIEQAQINSVSTAWAAPLTNQATYKTNAAAFCSGTSYTVAVNKRFNFHIQTLHMMKHCYNYRNALNLQSMPQLGLQS